MANADTFDRFFVENEPAIRRAVAARFGNEIGRDSAAEAFAVAWRTWDRVSDMDNPGGCFAGTTPPPEELGAR